MAADDLVKTVISASALVLVGTLVFVHVTWFYDRPPRCGAIRRAGIEPPAILLGSRAILC